jgi:predicted nucleotidyltransferase
MTSTHAGRYNGGMTKQPPRYVQPYRYASPNIPLSAIKRFARRIADQFHPDKIILFGSYAYGTPHEESDVDLLVIMPCRNEIDQSIRIDCAFERPFSLDLIVRTPYHMKQGLKEGDCDWFLREIVEKGKVLYEAPNGQVGPHAPNAVGPEERGSRAGRVAGQARFAAIRKRWSPLPLNRI